MTDSAARAPALGLSFEGGEAAGTVAGLARAAEAAGVATLWPANHLFQRDPVVQASAALAATTRLRAGLMAVSPYAVHPVQAAMAAATLNEHFPGRVLLCLGTGAPGDFAAAGLARPAPLAVLGESLDLARALLAGGTVEHLGGHFQVRGRALATGAQPVPLYLAATGPRMLELAGRAADGVLLSAGASLAFVRASLDRVAAAAGARAVRRSGLVFVSVDRDGARARDRVRRVLALVLRGAHHRANLEAGGTVLDQAALDRAVAAGDWARAEALISDEIVLRHAACGTPAEVHARLADYRRAGLDEVVLAGIAAGDEPAAVLAALQEPEGS